MKKIGNFEFITPLHFHHGRYEYDLLAPYRMIRDDVKKLRKIRKEDKMKKRAMERGE